MKPPPKLLSLLDSPQRHLGSALPFVYHKFESSLANPRLEQYSRKQRSSKSGPGGVKSTPASHVVFAINKSKQDGVLVV